MSRMIPAIGTTVDAGRVQANDVDFARAMADAPVLGMALTPGKAPVLTEAYEHVPQPEISRMPSPGF